MKKFGYLGLSVLPGVVLSLAVISGCNSEEAPKPAPAPVATEGPKMEAKAGAPAAPAAKPEDKK